MWREFTEGFACRVHLALLVALTGSSRVAGQMAFVPAGQFRAVPGSRTLAADDLNGDGFVDVATVHSGGTLSLLWGDGGGGFDLGGAAVLGGISGVETVDFDADGDRDLVFLRVIAGSPPADLVEFLEFYENDGNGGFSYRFDLETPVGIDNFLQGIAGSDVNGDGFEDLAVTDSFDLYIFLNAGTPPLTYVRTQRFTPSGLSLVGITTADVNGDQAPDVALTVRSTNSLHTYINDGAGGFAPGPTTPVGLNPVSVAAADLNDDGQQDLAVANEGDFYNQSPGSVLLLRGEGTGFFPERVELGLASYPGRGLVLADLEGDGDRDIAVAAFPPATGGLATFLNDSDPRQLFFAPQEFAWTGDWLDAADFDGDALTDLALLSFDTGEVTVLLNGGLEFLRGDGNGDGAVHGLSDAIYLLNYQFVAGAPGPPCADAADVDDDGLVCGLVDGALLLMFQFVPGSVSPGPPGPFECGSDPSTDMLGCVRYGVCP